MLRILPSILRDRFSIAAQNFTAGNPHTENSQYKYHTEYIGHGQVLCGSCRHQDRHIQRSHQQFSMISDCGTVSADAQLIEH